MIVSLLLGAVISTTLFAQQPSTPAPGNPPAVEGAAPSADEQPASTTKPKSARQSKTKAAIAEPPVTLAPGKAVVTGKNVNVRAQAKLNSESIAQLNPGDEVTVLEQINLDKFKPDEPRQWAKITFPSSAGLWVHTSYIDKTTMTVIPDKLNVRAGRGENYSVVDTLERGTQVSEVLTDGSWMKIAATPNAHAYIAAMYLRQEASETTAASAATTTVPETTEPVTTPTPVVAAEPSVTDAAPTTAQSETSETSAAGLMTSSSPSLLPAELPAEEVPPPPRVVSHEGIVKPTVSIQAPTTFALVDPTTRKIINYLESPSTNLNVANYKGLRIVVTGEEGLDARWTNTPVITIKRIHVVE